jgi:hypothetical protein
VRAFKVKKFSRKAYKSRKFRPIALRANARPERSMSRASASRVSVHYARDQAGRLRNERLQSALP